MDVPAGSGGRESRFQAAEGGQNDRLGEYGHAAERAQENPVALADRVFRALCKKRNKQFLPPTCSGDM
jgi:hypothetical protein